MRTPSEHRSRVLASPWKGVFCTFIESGCHFSKHWHSTFGVGVLESGAQRSASGRGQVDAYAGDLITTNPGEVHDGRPLGGPSRLWRMVYLDPEALNTMKADPSSRAVPDFELTRPVITDSPLRQALRVLFARFQAWGSDRNHPDADVLACEESLVATCGLLLSRHATSFPLREVAVDVRQVRDRLADDLVNPPTLTDMALMSGLSKYQLLRRFEKVYGVPPHAWLLQQRAERARHLISDGGTLVDVAAACGFADQSHMTRIFARQFGFTPGAWRKAAAAAVGALQ